MKQSDIDEHSVRRQDSRRLTTASTSIAVFEGSEQRRRRSFFQFGTPRDAVREQSPQTSMRD
jgi:hypothetical protein